MLIASDSNVNYIICGTGACDEPHSGYWVYVRFTCKPSLDVVRDCKQTHS